MMIVVITMAINYIRGDVVFLFCVCSYNWLESELKPLWLPYDVCGMINTCWVISLQYKAYLSGYKRIFKLNYKLFPWFPGFTYIPPNDTPRLSW